MELFFQSIKEGRCFALHIKDIVDNQHAGSLSGHGGSEQIVASWFWLIVALVLIVTVTLQLLVLLSYIHNRHFQSLTSQ